MGRRSGPGYVGPVIFSVFRATPVAAVAPSEPQEVEVHETAPPPPPRDPSVAGSVISEERLRAPGQTAADVLRTQPGVGITETGGYGAPSTASIRGATAAQTPVYLAGIRLNDDVGGAADLSLVPLWLLNRVDVYRSNAPLDGDDLGIGGAVFFEPRIPRRTGAGVGAAAGSFGTHALWAHAEGAAVPGAALVGVRFDGARNDYTFVDDHGTRFDASDDRVRTHTNADASTVDAWAMGRAFLSKEAHADLIVNDTEREQGLPGLTLFPSRRARARTSRRLVAVRTRVPCGRSEACIAIATTSVLASRTAYDDPLREIGLGAPRLEIAGTRVAEALRVRARILEWLRLSPALDASIENLSADSTGAVGLEARRFSTRAGLAADVSVADAVTVHGLGSAECNGTRTRGDTPWTFPAGGSMEHGSVCSGVEPGGRVGVEFGSRPVRFLSNVGRYVRVPTLAELFGISGVVRGNADLTPESGVSADVGVRAEAPPDWLPHGGWLDAFAFLRSVSRLIAYQRSSLGYVRPFNVGRARLAGVELQAGLRPTSFTLVELAATLLDPRDTSDDRPANDVLPYQPRLVLAPRVEVGLPSGGSVVDRATISATYFYESSRYADRAGLVVIPEQGSLDVDVEVATPGRLLAMRVRVSNVFDRARVDLVGYPLSGRAAHLALEATW